VIVGITPGAHGILSPCGSSADGMARWGKAAIFRSVSCSASITPVAHWSESKGSVIFLERSHHRQKALFRGVVLLSWPNI